MLGAFYEYKYINISVYDWPKDKQEIRKEQ